MDTGRQHFSPLGWIECHIGDVTLPVYKINPKGDPDREIIYIDISGIDNVRNMVGEVKKFLFRDAPSRARQIVRPGDVVFSTVRPYLRNIASVPEKYDGEIASTGFSVLRPAQGIDPAFLFYKAISTDFVNALSGEQYGVSYPAVKDEQVRAQPFGLPPTNEQHRIVTKVEELFSELDKGIESLKTAREQIRVYRQAVLKQAFEGKLTEQWREKNSSTLPNSQSIADQLEEYRLRAWHDPSVSFRRGAYRSPIAYDTEDTPSLPAHWTLVSMDALCHHITSGSRGWSKFYDLGNSTFIMAQNVRPGRYDSDFIQRVYPPDGNAETERTRAKLNDLLVTIVGANTGNLCRFNLDVSDHYVCQSVALMRLARPEYTRFLELYFQSQHGGLRQYKRYIYGAGRPHLSFEQLKQTVVPLPSVEEAQTIAELVEQILTDLDSLEESINIQLKRSDGLRQSILKKAFSGQLVEQDPNDESASVLLERIMAEKVEQGKNKKNNNKRKDAA